jgi:hypothetical protein
MSVRPFVRPSVRFLQSTTPLTVTTQLIDVKLYNVLEIHCSCAQWFLDFSLKAGWGVVDCRNLTDGRTNGRTDIKCLSNGRKNLITLKDQTKKMYQSSREIPRYLHKKVWTNPLSGYVYIIYIYQWMSVQFCLHIFNKKFWLQFIYNKLISTSR